MSVMPPRHISRRSAVFLVIALLTLYVLVPRLSSFRDSISTLRAADLAYLGLGFLSWLATFFATALVYKFIALQPLPYARTLLIQAASGFTNRLMPAGAGAVAINIRYLTKQRHSAVQAAAVAAYNNLLGFTGNIILLLGALSFGGGTFNDVGFHASQSELLAGVAAALIIVLILLRNAGSKLVKTAQKTIALIARHTARQPLKLVLALLASMAITTGYSLTLYCVALAFNVHLGAAQILLVMTAGVAAATITPTPGGLGGAEAGLVALLLASGVSSHQALAVALTYRFFVYWLPIIPGFICIQLALRRRYV